VAEYFLITENPDSLFICSPAHGPWGLFLVYASSKRVAMHVCVLVLHGNMLSFILGQYLEWDGWVI
jgi:hypothetical protein